ncbi:MAG: IS66 family transposase [Spirochaetales bacterium]|nr:IS66 family transposase [Spirochaetales bacterium]
MEPYKDEKLLHLTDGQLGVIYDSGKANTVALLKFLITEINNLKAEVQELKKTLSKDSHNSNNPPSSDNMLKKPKSLRKSTGKKPCGQKGHEGETLRQIENPDRIEDRSPKGKCDCGRSLKNAKTIESIIRQLFDCSLPSLFVTQFQGNVLKCACGQIHYPDFPDEVVKETQYGNSIKSLAVYLKHYGFISYERMSELFSEVFGINLSQGTLVNFVNECAERVESVVEEIKATLKKAEVLHCDESGMRIEKSTAWLHSASTEFLTFYYPHKRRGIKAMEAMGILSEFNGTVVHDHWHPYFRYDNCLHGLCNAHNLRELIFFEENGEEWAEKIKNCLLSAKREKESHQGLSEKQIKKYKIKMHQLINDGLRVHPEKRRRNKARGRPSQSKEFNLLRRLRDRFDEVLRFILDDAVPFDNNQGERDVRMLKIQQKVSGSFRSMKGAQSFCIIRSYISSIRKCGQAVFEALASVWTREIVLPKAILRAE